MDTNMHINRTNPFKNFNAELVDIQSTFIAIQASVGTITIAISLFVLAIFCSTKQKTEGNSRRFFIALTFADLQSGIICTISFYHVDLLITHPYCMVRIGIVYYTMLVTFLLLVSMTIDRYLAIIHPISYKRHSTPAMFYTAVAVSWTTGAIFGLCIYFTAYESAFPGNLCIVSAERTSETLLKVYIFAIYVPGTLFAIYANVRILKVIWNSMLTKKDRFKNLRQAILQGNFEEVISGINIREVRASLILFLSISFFFLIWLPWGIIFNLIRTHPERVSLKALLSIFLLLQVDSMIHPFLYVRSIGDVREIVTRWISCCSQRKLLKSAPTSVAGSQSQTHSTAKPLTSFV